MSPCNRFTELCRVTALPSSTMDETEGEDSGRGLLMRRAITEVPSSRGNGSRRRNGRRNGSVSRIRVCVSNVIRVISVISVIGIAAQTRPQIRSERERGVVRSSRSSSPSRIKKDGSICTCTEVPTPMRLARAGCSWKRLVVVEVIDIDNSRRIDF